MRAGILGNAGAGVVFGGHSMRKDTITQSLAILNKLWSGEAVRFGRRTSEVHDLIGGRLTMGLAVQPETLRSFFDSADGLARGMGFVARFLIAYSRTPTQGTRSYLRLPRRMSRA